MNLMLNTIAMTLMNHLYALAKNDPDWYYDHYEYEDNYDIDDYLESEGYD